MSLKRWIIQVVAAILLYVAISLILEKEFTNDIVVREIWEGLAFGLLYGVFIWLRDKFMKKKE